MQVCKENGFKACSHGLLMHVLYLIYIYVYGKKTLRLVYPIWENNPNQVGCLQQEKELSLFHTAKVCSSWIILHELRGGRKSCVLILSISLCALEFTNKMK